MFKTTAGTYRKHELEQLYTTVKSRGAKLVTGALGAEFTGVLVTTTGKTIPARYNAKVVYWLSHQQRDAFFVPRSHCISRLPAEYGMPVTIWHALKDGSVELVDNAMKFGNIVREQSVYLEGMREDPCALAYELDCYNGKWYASPSYNTPVAGIWVKNSSTAVLAANYVNFEDKQMEDLSAIMFGEDLFETKVKFKNSDRQYSYKSTVQYQAGDRVVVDSPTDGLVVVTVVSSTRGLDVAAAGFAQYKWIVSLVDVAEYERLKGIEIDFLAKAKREAQKRKAIAQLAELGVSADEYRSALFGSASKD